MAILTTEYRHHGLSVRWREARIRPGVITASLLGAVTVSAAVALQQGHPDLLGLAAVLLASILSSIAGFAFSAICGAMLFHLWADHVQVVQVMMICSIANQAAMVWSLRRDIQLPTLMVFLFGGLAGLPIGVAVLLFADHGIYDRALGLVLIAYGLYMLAGRARVVATRHQGLDFVAGMVGGITGGAAGFPGASVTIWAGLQGWDKARQRALFQPFILLMQVTALLSITLAVAGSRPSAGFDLDNLFYVPAGLLGTRLGMQCFHRLSNQQFAMAVNLLLIVSGLSYMV